LLPDIEMKRQAYFDYEAGVDGKFTRAVYEVDPNTYYSATGKTNAEFIQTDFHAARGTVYGTKGITIASGKEAAEKMASANYTTQGGLVTKYRVNPDAKLLNMRMTLKESPILHSYLKEILSGITDASKVEVARALPDHMTFQSVMDNLDLVYSRDEVLTIKDTFSELISNNQKYEGYYSGGTDPKIYLFDENNFKTLESIDVAVKNDLATVTKTVQQEFSDKYKSHLGKANQMRLKYGDEIIAEADKLQVKTQEQYIADTVSYVKRQEILNESTVANINNFMDFVTKDLPAKAIDDLKVKTGIAHAMNAEDFAALKKQMNLFSEEMRMLDVELKMMDTDTLARIAENLVFCNM